MGVSIPSEAEYAEQTTDGDFKLLPADDYILEVRQITIQPGKVDIFDKPKEGQAQRVYDGLEVRFHPVSFANGDEVVDEDGEDIPENRDPLFFDWFDPAKVGLKPQPSKARKFFAFSTGVELEDRIDIEDFQSLVGKRLLGTVVIKPNAKGIKKNKITDYRPIRVRRGRSAAAAPAVDVAAAAKEIFAAPADGDLPF